MFKGWKSKTTSYSVANKYVCHFCCLLKSIQWKIGSVDFAWNLAWGAHHLRWNEGRWLFSETFLHDLPFFKFDMVWSEDRAGPPNLIFHGFSRVHRQAISVRPQLLGDDHEEFLRSIESYAWEPVEGWCQDLWGSHLWEMNIIYNSDKPTFFGGFSKFQWNIMKHHETKSRDMAEGQNPWNPQGEAKNRW